MTFPSLYNSCIVLKTISSTASRYGLILYRILLLCPYQNSISRSSNISSLYHLDWSLLAWQRSWWCLNSDPTSPLWAWRHCWARSLVMSGVREPVSWVSWFRTSYNFFHRIQPQRILWFTVNSYQTQWSYWRIVKMFLPILRIQPPNLSSNFHKNKKSFFCCVNKYVNIVQSRASILWLIALLPIP